MSSPILQRSFTFFAIFLAFATVACGPSPEIQTPLEAPKEASDTNSNTYVLEGQWDLSVKDSLEQFLVDLEATSDAEGTPSAVFDWDNTCIFNDVGEATLRYQLSHLAIRLNPTQMGTLIPLKARGVTVLGSGEKLSDVREDILSAYKILWPLMKAGKIDDAKGSSAHLDFRVKVLWLYEALIETEGVGAEFAYPWAAQFLGGWRPDEIPALAATVHAESTGAPVGKSKWEGATAGKIGVVSQGFKTGVRTQPEIISLMKALTKAGAEVHVVSASPEYIVEEFAHLMGYPVPKARVHGMRLKMDGEVFAPLLQDPETHPITYRAGKSALIRKKISALPSFVAGDSTTDYEMLTDFSETKVRLVINRNKSGLMKEMYQEALSAPKDAASKTLLQGRDENLGAFRAGQETVSMGEQAPRPLQP